MRSSGTAHRCRSSVLVSTCLLLLCACSGAHGPGRTAPTSLEAQRIEQEHWLESTWGIRIEGLFLSSAGYMLDFRYRILDPAKAVKLMDRKLKAYLIDERTGQAFIVPAPPKIGALRQTVETGLPAAGKIAFVFFANPGRALKSGDLATLVIGECRITHVPVQ